MANEILGVVLSEAERHAARRVASVILRVGVLRAVEPEHLCFLFSHLAHGTLADGARLEIQEEPVRVECVDCGKTEARSFAWECPRCKGSGITVQGGDSLEIVSLEIDI